MNFSGNFRRIGSIDIASLRGLVKTLGNDAWNEFPVELQRVEAHRDTKLIALVYDPDFRHTHPTRLPALASYESALRPALAAISTHYEAMPTGRALIKQFGLGYFIRATLVRLGAGCQIDEHRDSNYSLMHSHRLHLPVVTNEDVHFSVGTETINMREGEIWEINNWRAHSVRNDGATDRVHVILDFVLRGEKCCCGQKQHPDTHCSPQACPDKNRSSIPCTCFAEA